jgi:lysophospholipase L1-like esterase
MAKQHSSQQQTPHNRNWKSLLPLLWAPFLAVSAAAAGWLWLPRPTLPAAIESMNDVLTRHTPVEATTTSSRNAEGADTSRTSMKTSDAHAASSPQPAIPPVTEPKGDRTLVALGDSITFGYHLPGATATTPSLYAYPYVVGRDEHWNVIDLGVPGWESSNLLDALRTKKYQDALKKADVVTLDIGSNDLLHSTYDLLADVHDQRPSLDDVLADPKYQEALQVYEKNLPAIVEGIKKWTSAPIVLLNLYDPFPDGSSIHEMGEQLVAAANQVIVQTAALKGLPVVDVYSRINHHQEQYVGLDYLDIHPTLTGQQVIADAVEQVLHDLLRQQPVRG